MEKLKAEIRDFVDARNWDQYHTPKNLAMALAVEASELLEIFQWLTPEESANVDADTLNHIEEEIGDIMIYLTTISAFYDLDPVKAAKKKITKNGLKYPQPEDKQTGLD